ncbi:MAG: hypothetical protein HOP17_08280 [Acidobacteria bacterium]|nr:hypothetical protein [Acidobacteriota bacterium]
MLEVKSADIGLLNTILKIAIAASVAAGVLGTFYVLMAERLMAASLSISTASLLTLGLAKGADFVAGSVFLGVCFVIFVGTYLAAANWLGAIERSDKDKIYSLMRRFTLRGRVEQKTA